MSGALWSRSLVAIPLAGIMLAATGCGHGAKVQHGSIEVFYKEGATKAEADRLGVVLVKQWGAAGPRRSVQLNKTADGYRVRMVVKKEFQNDEKMLNALAFDGARMSRDAFDGAPVELDACDEYFTSIKVLPPRADVRYGVVNGNAEVFFPTATDRDDAQRLANYLANGLKEAPAPVSFKLARRGDVVEVHMVVQPAVLQNPATVAGLRQDKNDIAANVFRGTTVEMHLCDEMLNVVQVLK